jgi:hypothetical protein
LEVVHAEALGEFLFAEDVFGEGLFAFLQFADLFFDAVLDEQTVGDDFGGLADAMRSIDGLVFNGGIPPRIEEDDVAGGGEVEAGPTGFQRDEENSRTFLVLE